MKLHTSISIIFVVGIVLGIIYLIGNNTSNNPMINAKTNTNIAATTVQVGTFYDGQAGYSLSIPSGNSSTCIWTYAGGSADIPYTQTTYAQTATQKHTVYSSDYYDWKVSCVDDFGNQYVGVFPKGQ